MNCILLPHFINVGPLHCHWKADGENGFQQCDQTLVCCCCYFFKIHIPCLRRAMWNLPVLPSLPAAVWWEWRTIFPPCGSYRSFWGAGSVRWGEWLLREAAALLIARINNLSRLVSASNRQTSDVVFRRQQRSDQRLQLEGDYWGR